MSWELSLRLAQSLAVGPPGMAPNAFCGGLKQPTHLNQDSHKPVHNSIAVHRGTATWVGAEPPGRGMATWVGHRHLGTATWARRLGGARPPGWGTSTWIACWAPPIPQSLLQATLHRTGVPHDSPLEGP